MSSVASCLRQHAPAYLAKFRDLIPLGHRKVLSAITRCRTGELGGVLYQCNGCGRAHWVGRSCGNRHCPNCQAEKTAAWLEKQTAKLLPVHHFLVTFTVPKELRSLLRGAQADGYKLLFQASAESIRDVGAATKSLASCQLGYFGVLHTWGRDPMVYHPHVHFVVPGGGVRLSDSRDSDSYSSASSDNPPLAAGWQSTPTNFLFHHGTLVRVYKAKLADALRECDLYDQVPKDVWAKTFVVDIKPVGDGRAVLKYLAPYVHRVAISDSRIEACDERSVTFRYTPSKSQRDKTRTVSGQEFVRGFLQHTLPPRFQKIRYYGWMSSNSRVSLDELKWLVWLFLGWTYWLASGHAPQAKPIKRSKVRCAECGNQMHIVDITFEPTTLSDHSLAYLDSG